MPRRIAAIIRDKIGRLLTHEHEVEREALRLITKNKELPLATRFRAQRLLGDFPRYGRYISLKDRCTVNGHARVTILLYLFVGLLMDFS